MYGQLLCILLVLFIIYLQRKCWHFIWQLNGWHGLISQPFLWLILAIHLEPSGLITSIIRFRKYFSKPLAIVVWNRIILLVDDPDIMGTILKAPQCLNKTFLHNGFFARHGLLHAAGEKWKIRRKQLNPSFNLNTILTYFDNINLVANKMQQQLRIILNTTAQGERIIPFEVLDNFLSKGILEVSCLTIMGTETNLTEEDPKRITQTYKYLMNVSALRCIKPWLQIDRIFHWLDRENCEKTRESNKIVDEFVKEIIQRQRSNDTNYMNLKNSVAQSEMCEGSDTDDVNRNRSTNSSRNFIQQILYLEKLGELSSEDVLNETQSMVMVSFETVSTTLIIILLCLATNHDCQEQLRQEIMKTFSKVIDTSDHLHQSSLQNDIQIDMEHLQQMPYLEMIINESLRLLTTIPMNVRHVSSKLAVRMGQRMISIPKDSIIALDTFNMQRSKEIWGPKALQYYPEHFSKTENSTNQRHPYAFLPFSKGLRTCIGSRYSIFVLKIFLINLIANFEFTSNNHLDDLRFVEGISLNFLNANSIQFRIRCLKT